MRNLRDATLLGRGLDRVGLGLNRGPAIPFPLILREKPGKGKKWVLQNASIRLFLRPMHPQPLV